VAESRQEPQWHASLALLICAGVYLVLPHRLAVGPKFLLPVLILLPLLPLSLRRDRHPDEAAWVHRSTVGLLMLITAANAASTGLLVHHLLHAHVVQGRSLLYSAIALWCTNVFTFGVWLWELDRGGPAARGTGKERTVDIQFPQMENPTLAPADWRPNFFDYLYTSFANGTSFAPADAVPLTGIAKALFAMESIISLVTIAMVAARAVNILN